VIQHKKAPQMREAALKALANQMHSLDVSATVTAEMSRAKADGTYAGEMDTLLRLAVTLFDPAKLLRDAEEAMG